MATPTAPSADPAPPPPTRRAVARAALAGVAVGLAALHAATARAQPAATPTAAVEALHAALLAVMRDAAGGLGVRGRAERLRPALQAALDLPAMARAAVGPARWNAASEVERADLAAAFADWTVAVYASRFTGFSGERFETLGEDPAPTDDAARLVRTRLVRPGPSDAPVPLTYLMRRAPDGRWRATDIYLQGTISEIATRRAEFAATLRDGGPARLAADLRARAAALLAG